MTKTITLLSQVLQEILTRSGEWLLTRDQLRSYPDKAAEAQVKADESHACAEILEDAIERQRQVEVEDGGEGPWLGFAVVDLLGHKQRIGRVREVRCLDTAFLEISEPIEGDPAIGTRLFRHRAGVIFGLEFVDEAEVLRRLRPRRLTAAEDPAGVASLADLIFTPPDQPAEILPAAG